MSRLSFGGLVRTDWVFRSLLASALVASLASGCSSPTTPTPTGTTVTTTPTTPTPTPTSTPSPTADPLALSCPAPVTTGTTSATGTAVTFTTPTASGGQAPVTVACTPASGSAFAAGLSTVQCTATDALNRTASCSFAITLSRTPQLSVTKFLAFGDSITAGEVSFPVAGIYPQSDGMPNFRLVVVPTASYPSALKSLLTARYSAQASAIVMSNEGIPGELARAAATLVRFGQAVSSQRPDAVLIMHGYNDITATTVTATATAVNMMAAEARNRGARVYIATLAPPKPGGRNSRPADIVVAYNDRLRGVARGEGAVLVDVHAALLTDLNTYIGADGLHPTEIGYRKIAETFLAAIQANLEVR